MIVVGSLLLGLSMPLTASRNVSAAYTYPSTHAENITKGWAHVEKINATVNSITLVFHGGNQIPTNFSSCFEYRIDGDTTQALASANPNPAVEDRYPHLCIAGKSSTPTLTFNATNYIEVRSTFGAESSERFDWTRFDIYNPDPSDSHELNVSGTVYRDTALNDCYNKTTCENRAEVLNGWEMRLYKENGATWEFVKSATSDSNGLFNLGMQKAAGTYHVCEVLKAGWAQQLQTWSGSGYKVDTPNASGDTSEGPYCNTISYDDTADRSHKSNFGNVDVKKPTTTVLSPANNSIFNAATPINIAIRSTDNESGIAKVVANVYGATGLIGSCVNQVVSPAVASHDFTCTINPTILDEGAYFIKTNALDAAGLLSNTVTWYFTIDKTVPVVTIDDLTTIQGAPAITGTLDDLTATLSVTINGVDYTNEIMFDGNEWTLPEDTITPGLTVGAYVITAQATDAAGNIGSATAQLIVKAPTVVLPPTTNTPITIPAPTNPILRSANSNTNSTGLLSTRTTSTPTVAAATDDKETDKKEESKTEEKEESNKSKARSWPWFLLIIVIAVGFMAAFRDSKKS